MQAVSTNSRTLDAASPVAYGHHMTKNDAAEILVNYINTRARHYGVTQVTKEFIEEMTAEALTAGVEGSAIRRAAEVAPHWMTIRATARRAAKR